MDIASYKRSLQRLFQPAAGGGIDIASYKRSLQRLLHPPAGGEALPVTAGGGVDIFFYKRNLQRIFQLKQEESSETPLACCRC